LSKFIDETCKGIITASIFLLLNIDVKRVGAFTLSMGSAIEP
jgi:hypothetical protein